VRHFLFTSSGTFAVIFIVWQQNTDCLKSWQASVVDMQKLSFLFFMFSCYSSDCHILTVTCIFCWKLSFNLFKLKLNPFWVWTAGYPAVHTSLVHKARDYPPFPLMARKLYTTALGTGLKGFRTEIFVVWTFRHFLNWPVCNVIACLCVNVCSCYVCSFGHLQTKIIFVNWCPILSHVDVQSWQQRIVMMRLTQQRISTTWSMQHWH